MEYTLLILTSSESSMITDCWISIYMRWVFDSIVVYIYDHTYNLLYVLVYLEGYQE
jgi:hypothetical protein